MSARLLLAERLIDGTGAEPLPRAAVLLRDGVIERVLPQASLSRTERAGRAEHEFGDATILPGLIDSHVHLTFNAAPTHDEVRRAVTHESEAMLTLRAMANAAAHLAGGVTTVRDVGDRGFVSLAVRDAIRAGWVPGPRVRAAGPAISTPRGHLHYLGAVASGVEEVRREAQRILDAGADLAKICATGGIMTAESDPIGPQYSVEELHAAVQVAGDRGKPVAAHVLGAEALRRCVEAGVTSIEHCSWLERPGEYVFCPEVAGRMIRHGVVAGLTFAGVGQARYLEERWGIAASADLRAWKVRMAARHATERELIAAGVKFVLHSDSGVRETPFGGFWKVPAAACFELGLSPVDAIRAVTSCAADLLGVGDRVGRLAPGMTADLLVVSGDASERIEALASPLCVLRYGETAAEGGSLRWRTAATAGPRWGERGPTGL